MTQPPSAATSSAIVAENIAAWRGQDVIDRDGDKVGKLDDVFYDGETDRPAFAAIKSGLIGKHLTLIPLAGASVGPSHVRVDVGKKTVKDAPSFDPDVELSVEDEAAAYRFYGLEYATAGEGARRLAKR